MQLTKINYKTETEVIPVIASDGHTWVTVSDLTQILNITQPTVSHHIKELGKLNQLEEGKHVITLPIKRTEGKREVTRQIKHYSELAVIRIGFRANSPEALIFQEWAAETLLNLGKGEPVTLPAPEHEVTTAIGSRVAWDYEATHELLNKLGAPAMNTLATRVALMSQDGSRESFDGYCFKVLKFIVKTAPNTVWPHQLDQRFPHGPLRKALNALIEEGLIHEVRNGGGATYTLKAIHAYHQRYVSSPCRD